MSQELGYDVSLLKDRMLQLRNRYNLEKRRIEATQQQYPKRIVKSPWPLYSYLTFLSDHIKARRSFRTMRAKHSISSDGDIQEREEPDETQDCGNETRSDGCNALPPNFCSMVHNNPDSVMNIEERFKDMESRMRSERTDNGTEKFRAFGRFLTTSLIEMDERDALLLIENFTSQIVRSLLSEPTKTTEKHLNLHCHTNGDIQYESSIVNNDINMY